ncbi:hypothetical protein BT69DRAFT_194002 [Atractiella rhizophila]|nr:hypothetical protein BT69DRAFT_194002 [Atractiella rhizophila]
MSQLVTLGSSHAPAVGYLIALKRRPLDANSADLLQRERELMRGRRELAKGFQRNSKGGFVGMGEDGTQWSEEYLKDSEFIYSELERLEKEGKGTGLQVVKGTSWSGERDVLVDEKDVRAKCLIRKDHIKIGLMDSCDIRLKIPGVSRLHVTLDCSHLPTRLISHSTNPPFLSPHAPITRNEPVEIKNGTIINIYNRRFVYVAFASPPPPGVFDDDAPPKAQHVKEPRRNAAPIPPTPQHKKPLGYRLESVKRAQSFPSAEIREEEEQGDVSVTSTIDEGAPEEDLICLDEVSPILSPKETESIVKSPRDKLEVPSTPTLEKRPRSLYPPLTASRPIDPYEPVEAVSQAQFEKEKEMLRARRERRRASVGDGLASGGMKRSLTFVDSKSKEEWLEGMKKSMTTGSLTKEEVKGKEVVRRTLSIEDLKDMEGVKVAKEGSRNSRRISDMLTGGQSAGEEEDDTSSSDSGSESSSVGQRMGPRSQVDQDVGSEEEFEEKHEDMEVSLNDDSSDQGDYATPPRSTTPPGMPEEHESPERRVERVTPPKTPVITSVASIPHSQSFSRRLSLREKVLIRNGISATIEREKESLSVSPTEMATEIPDVEMADGEAVCNGEEQEQRAKAIDAERLETERQKGRNSTEKKVGRRSDSYADLRSAAREQEKMAAEAEEDAEIESTSPTQQRRAVFSRPSMTPRANYPAIPSRPSSPFPREPKANLPDFTLSPSKQNSVARGPRRVPTDSPAKSVLAAKARISGAHGGVPTNEAVIRDTTLAEDDQVGEAAKAETPKSKFQQIRESILASRRQSLEPNDSAVMFTASVPLSGKKVNQGLGPFLPVEAPAVRPQRKTTRVS